jgi:hypothetical protein
MFAIANLSLQSSMQWQLAGSHAVQATSVMHHYQYQYHQFHLTAEVTWNTLGPVLLLDVRPYTPLSE